MKVKDNVVRPKNSTMFNKKDEIPLPPLDDFMNLPDQAIAEFCHSHDIKTVYLPVDGTRRAFLQHALQNNLSLSALKDESTFLEKYSEYLIPAMIKFLSKFYDLGLKTLIFLLMDDTAFSRGKIYLEKTSDLGIRPLSEDFRYLEFYNKYDIKVVFGGFNHLYEEYGIGKVLKVFEAAEQLTTHHESRQLVFFTGSNPPKDYLLVAKIIEEMKATGDIITIESVIERLYKLKLDSIDFGMFYGFPRDKILPPLLWNNSKRFYSFNPSLTLTKQQIKVALYHVAASKYLINDDYLVYSRHLHHVKGDDNLLSRIHLSEEFLVGPELYGFREKMGELYHDNNNRNKLNEKKSLKMDSK